ncbi:MAG: hypothetical protein V2A58_11410, partial [Planctomycetota bacterium]
MTKRTLSSGRLGLSPAPVIICVVILVIGLLVSYVMHKNAQANRAELDKEKARVEETQRQLDQHLADLAQWQALVRMSAETAAARLKDSKQDNLANYSEFMIGSRNQ